MGLAKPLLTKAVAKTVAKTGAKGLAEAAVSASAKHGIKSLLQKKKKGRR